MKNFFRSKTASTQTGRFNQSLNGFFRWLATFMFLTEEEQKDAGIDLDNQTHI